MSVKGVVVWDDCVLLLRNEREEWELPGGRLEPDDASTEEALQREFREEVALDVAVEGLVDTWIYDVAGRRVLIVTYRCHAERPAELTHSHEHRAVALVPISSLGEVPLPAGYVRSIRRSLDLA